MSENDVQRGPLGLHDLSPAPGSHRDRKRVGRGTGSGNGKTSGRGQKGQLSRAGSHRMRAGFAGGQNPLQMQVGKLRGPHKKTSMPFGPFRTHTQPVNLRDLARRFEAGAEVTPPAMLAAGVVRHLRHPVKVLAAGELEVALHVTAHGFSAGARQKIEAAGGSCTVLVEADERSDESSKLVEATPAEVVDSADEPSAEAPAEPEAEADAEPEAAADTEAAAEPEAGEADEADAADEDAEA